MPDDTAVARLRPRRLLVAAGAVLLVGLAVLGALLVRTIDGYRDWPADSAVPQDNESHLVRVEPDRTFYVWVLAIDDSADCTITDGRSGEPVPLETVSSGPTRQSGVINYSARLSGTASSDQVRVTCLASDDEPVYVDALTGPDFFDPLGPLWPIPVLLGGVGAALLVAAGGIRILRRS
ncbi:MAG: hypothetical protein NTX33_11150 [Propionibacteriales bacterium]|nr:hypothetical protein [Propionibacteriales bacterium]